MATESRDGHERVLELEAAMNETGFGRFNVSLTLFCGLMLIGMIMETLGFSYVLPGAQCELRVTDAQKGWLATVPFACIILTSYGWGYLADTRGRKRVLAFSMAVGSLFSALSSLSPDTVTFVGLRAVAGVFCAAPSALGYAYLGEMTPIRYRDAAIVLGNASVTLGTGIVALVAWAVLSADAELDVGFLEGGYGPWRCLVALYALPYALCALLFFRFPESPKFLAAEGDREGAVRALAAVYSANTGRPPSDFPVDDVEATSESGGRRSVWRTTRGVFAGGQAGRTLLMCGLQFVIFAVTNGFYVWFPTIADRLTASQGGLCSPSFVTREGSDGSDGYDRCDDSLEARSFYVAFATATAVCFASLAAVALLRVCTKRTLLMAVFGSVGCCSVALRWAETSALSIGLLSAYQVCGVCIGIVNAFAVDAYPTSVRATAVCLTLTAGRIGSVFGTNLIGHLASADCPLNCFLFGALLWASAVACLGLPEERRESNKEP